MKQWTVQFVVETDDEVEAEGMKAWFEEFDDANSQMNFSEVVIRPVE